MIDSSDDYSSDDEDESEAISPKSSSRNLEEDLVSKKKKQRMDAMSQWNYVSGNFQSIVLLNNDALIFQHESVSKRAHVTLFPLKSDRDEIDTILEIPSIDEDSVLHPGLNLDGATHLDDADSDFSRYPTET